MVRGMKKTLEKQIIEKIQSNIQELPDQYTNEQLLMNLIENLILISNQRE